jgi:hypothetical protein
VLVFNRGEKVEELFLLRVCHRISEFAIELGSFCLEVDGGADSLKVARIALRLLINLLDKIKQNIFDDSLVDLERNSRRPFLLFFPSLVKFLQPVFPRTFFVLFAFLT